MGKKKKETNMLHRTNRFFSCFIILSIELSTNFTDAVGGVSHQESFVEKSGISRKRLKPEILSKTK